jgi:hypothetical protein
MSAAGKITVFIIMAFLGVQGETAKADWAAAEGQVLQYQALGRAFSLPLDDEILTSSPRSFPDQGWRLLSSAWNGAGLAPLGRFRLRDHEAVEIFMALMVSDAKGRKVASAQDEVFLSAQRWREFRGDLGPGEEAPETGAGYGLGVFSRDDDSLYALSLFQPPLAPPAARGKISAPALADTRARNMLMVSSLTLLDGLPVLVGASADSSLPAEYLQNVCRVFTLFLRLSNKRPAASFFDPAPDNLVLAGRKITVARPAGGCLLKAGYPRETMTLIVLRENLRGSHFYPLLAYAPCEALENWRQSRQYFDLSDYGLLGVIQREGQLRIADDFNSAKFLQGLKAGQTGKPLVPAQLDRRDWSAIIAGMAPGSLEELGHFGVDKYAGYWAILVRLAGPGAQAGGVLAGIMAVGMVNGLEMTSIRYCPLEREKVFTELLARQKSLFRQLSVQ